MIITKEVKKSRNVALRVASRARRVKRDSFNGKRESAGTRRGTRGESCRFEIRRVMGEKQKKKKKRRTISNSVSSIIRDLCSIREGGGHRRAFFFLLVTYPAGKIGGRGERRGLWVFWESAGRRTA